MGVPLDGIDLIGVSLEGFDGLVLAQLTHMDALISGAGGKGGVGLPVHIKGWG